MLKTKTFLLFAAVLSLAVVVRFADLGARPMHVDEAVQSYIFADLLEEGVYRYDPSHFHGPLPHFVNLPLLRALGISSLDILQAWQFRLQPALAGLLLVLLAGACARGSGNSAMWRAMLLATVSPTLVYFNRMAIHETLLAVCALAVPIAVARWQENQKLRWLLVTAAAFGCMHATKETWCIIAFSWAVAALILWPKKIRAAIKSAGAWRIALAVAVAMGVSFLLYSNFGQRPGGFADAWRTLFAYKTGSGHEKPWWYFLTDCLGFYRAGGWFAGEGVITLLALAGGAAAWLRRAKTRGAAGGSVMGRGDLSPLLTGRPAGPQQCKVAHEKRGGGVTSPAVQSGDKSPHSTETRNIPPLSLFLAISGAAQVVVYSIIKYKTPWLVLVPLASFVPLAAHGWLWLRGQAWQGWRNWVTWEARDALFLSRVALCALAIVAGLVMPMLAGNFDEPTSTDYNHAYAPTLPEADAKLARIAAALPPNALVAVIGEHYWPLPWYFRTMRDRAGYFSELGAPSAEELRAFALVIHAGYQLDPAVTGPGWRVLELRPGYYVSVSR